MGRPCIHIGPAVYQQSNSPVRRNKRRQRRAFHAFEPSYDHLSAYQCCSGASRRYVSIAFPGFYELQCLYDGRIFLLADRHNRRFRRFNHFRRVDDFHLLFFISIFLQFFFYNIFRAYQAHFYFAVLIGGFHRSFYNLQRSVIPAHRIDSNFYHF